VRGFPIASNMDKLVELHRDGVVKLDPEVIEASEAIARADAFSLAVAERAEAAREGVRELEIGIAGRLLATAKAGDDPLAVAAELEELETTVRRADRVVTYLEDVRERARDELASFAYEVETWLALDEGLQTHVLDRAAKALEQLPVGVDGMADLRPVPRQQVGKIRDALAEVEDAYALYGTLRRLAESLAVLCFANDGQMGRLPGDALDRLVFSFRTGYRLIDHNRPRWPESGTPLMRYIVENRAELGPWIPHGEDAWRAACAAALAEIVPEDVRAQREQWESAWR
jgi:hypothetical protein